MFQLNKMSLLVTVSSELGFHDFNRLLLQEGLFWGYHPLDNTDHALGHFLKKRSGNLYFFKYGGLSDLVSSLVVTLKNGHTMHLKDAPRKSIGPDFNRLIIGSRGQFGTIKQATLKLAAQPERFAQGVLLVRDRDQARAFLGFLVGKFLAPLYFRYGDQNVTKKFAKHLPDRAKSFQAVLFCLADIEEIIGPAIEIVEQWCATHQTGVFWCVEKDLANTFREQIFSPEVLREIREQYRTLLWTASDPCVPDHLEKRLALWAKRKGELHV